MRAFPLLIALVLTATSHAQDPLADVLGSNRTVLPVRKVFRTSASPQEVLSAVEQQAPALGLRIEGRAPDTLGLAGVTVAFAVHTAVIPEGPSGIPGFTRVTVTGEEVMLRGFTFQNVAEDLATRTVEALDGKGAAWAVRVPDAAWGSPWCQSAQRIDPQEGLPQMEGVHTESVDVMPALIGGMDALAERIVYSDQARRLGIGGRIFVSFVVTERGETDCFFVWHGLPAGLSEAAVAALSAVRFEPGREDGEAVRVMMSVPITFRLH